MDPTIASIIISISLMPTAASSDFFSGDFYGGIQQVYDTALGNAYQGWLIPVVGFTILGIVYNKTGSAANAMIVGILMAGVIFTSSFAGTVAAEVQLISYLLLALTISGLAYKLYRG